MVLLEQPEIKSDLFGSPLTVTYALTDPLQDMTGRGPITDESLSVLTSSNHGTIQLL